MIFSSMPLTHSATPSTFGFIRQIRKLFATTERQAILKFRRLFIKDGGPFSDLRPGEIIIMERSSSIKIEQSQISTVL